MLCNACAQLQFTVAATRSHPTFVANDIHNKLNARLLSIQRKTSELSVVIEAIFDILQLLTKRNAPLSFLMKLGYEKSISHYFRCIVSDTVLQLMFSRDKLKQHGIELLVESCLLKPVFTIVLISIGMSARFIVCAFHELVLTTVKMPIEVMSCLLDAQNYLHASFKEALIFTCNKIVSFIHRFLNRCHVTITGEPGMQLFYTTQNFLSILLSTF